VNLKPRRWLAAGALVASFFALTACNSASSGSTADVSGITQAQKAWGASTVGGAPAIAADLGRILDALKSNDPTLLSDANGTLSLDIGRAENTEIVPPAVHSALLDMASASLELSQRGGLPAANDQCRAAAAALDSPAANPSPAATVSVSAALNRRLVAWDHRFLGATNSPHEPSLFGTNGDWVDWFNAFAQTYSTGLPQGSAGDLSGGIINNDETAHWVGGPGAPVRYYAGHVQLHMSTTYSMMIVEFEFVTDSTGRHHLIVTPLQQAPPGVTFGS
jgi:hypothetical protein